MTDASPPKPTTTDEVDKESLENPNCLPKTKSEQEIEVKEEIRPQELNVETERKEREAEPIHEQRLESSRMQESLENPNCLPKTKSEQEIEAEKEIQIQKLNAETERKKREADQIHEQRMESLRMQDRQMANNAQASKEKAEMDAQLERDKMKIDKERREQLMEIYKQANIQRAEAEERRLQAEKESDEARERRRAQGQHEFNQRMATEQVRMDNREAMQQTRQDKAEMEKNAKLEIELQASRARIKERELLLEGKCEKERLLTEEQRQRLAYEFQKLRDEVKEKENRQKLELEQRRAQNRLEEEELSRKLQQQLLDAQETADDRLRKVREANAKEIEERIREKQAEEKAIQDARNKALQDAIKHVEGTKALQQIEAEARGIAQKHTLSVNNWVESVRLHALTARSYLSAKDFVNASGAMQPVHDAISSLRTHPSLTGNVNQKELKYFQTDVTKASRKAGEISSNLSRFTRVTPSDYDNHSTEGMFDELDRIISRLSRDCDSLFAIPQSSTRAIGF